MAISFKKSFLKGSRLFHLMFQLLVNKLFHIKTQLSVSCFQKLDYFSIPDGHMIKYH